MCPMRSAIRAAVLATVPCGLLWAMSACATAGDWPQILGPHRNASAQEEPTPVAWQGNQLAAVWRYQVGQGYAGPAVAQGRVILFHRVGDVERVESLDESTGRQQWQTDFPANYRGGVDPDQGPRCVPLVDGSEVFVFGAAGDLHCLRLEDGHSLWSRSLYQDFQGSEGYFGAGSSPLLVQEKLLVNVGGRGAGIVAIDRKTGQTIWQATDEGASYSSPVLARWNQQTVAVFVCRLNLVALDPDTGAVVFRQPFGRTGPTVSAASPVIFGNRLFVTACYQVGARLLAIGDDELRTVWSNDESLSSHYTTPIYWDGYLYGFHGREDYGNGELRCVDARAGAVMWRKTGTGVGHLVRVGKRLLVLTTDGRLRLVAPAPDKLRILAEAVLSTDTTRALPAYAHQCLLVRERSRNGNGAVIRFRLPTE